jgi:hypothetical protein
MLMSDTDCEQAIRRVLADKEAMRMFWRGGYEELLEHTSSGASQWIGRRLLTTFIAAVVTAGVVWLVKSGALK